MVQEIIVHKEKDCEDCIHFNYCWSEDTAIAKHFREYCYSNEQELWGEK